MRIVLVDDHTLFRMGVRHVLTNTPGHEVVGEASTARSAFRIVDALAPDVVLMDIAMPGMDGVLATREIGRRAPKARVLIVSAHDQVNDVLDALEAGAAGYALKSDGPETLIEAIRVVSRGQRYVAAALAPRLAAFEGRRRRASDVLGILSAREREVFRLASECVIARDMARELCIARKTVDTHLNRINRSRYAHMASSWTWPQSLGCSTSTRPQRHRGTEASTSQPKSSFSLYVVRGGDVRGASRSRWACAVATAHDRAVKQSSSHAHVNDVARTRGAGRFPAGVARTARARAPGKRMTLPRRPTPRDLRSGHPAGDR
jgi:DNA-binding NarL/FixJ family response regulator